MCSECRSTEWQLRLREPALTPTLRWQEVVNMQGGWTRQRLTADRPQGPKENKAQDRPCETPQRKLGVWKPESQGQRHAKAVAMWSIQEISDAVRAADWMSSWPDYSTQVVQIFLQMRRYFTAETSAFLSVNTRNSGLSPIMCADLNELPKHLKREPLPPLEKGNSANRLP